MQIKDIDLTLEEITLAYTDTIDNFQNKFASRRGIYKFIDTYVCYDRIEDIANLYNLLKTNNIQERNAIYNFVWANEEQEVFNKFLELIGED